MNRSFIFICLLFVSLTALAQKDFVQKGDKFMHAFKFEKAAKMYKKAADADANNIAAWEKLGMAFVMLQDNASAEAIYKTLSSNPKAAPINKFYYAQQLRMEGKYKEADEAYKAFAEAVPNDPRAMEFKNFARDVEPLTQDFKTYELNILPDNSPASEIGPAYDAGKLVFASNRGNGASGDYGTGMGYYDLYEQRSAGTGDSVIPAKLKGKVNKRFNDGPATFSTDGKEMIYSAANYKGKSKTGIRMTGLYHADFNAAKNKWINIKPLNINNPEYNVTHPALSKDGTRLFFVSDMPGGLGESDVYMSVKNGDKWEQPVNLGKDVNTAGAEMFPFIADDGTLYFSSDSRVGLGGLDIYSATQAGGKWSNIQNLGFGVNTSGDDLSYVSDETGKNGFIASQRSGGVGGDDIYKFKRLAEPVCGTVADAKTKNVIEGAFVTATNANGDQHRIHTDAKGNFCFNLQPGTEYKLVTAKDGYTAEPTTMYVNQTRNARQIISMEPHGGIEFSLDVTQKDGGALEGAVAFLINKSTGEVQQRRSDSTGQVKFDLYKDQEYELKVAKRSRDGAYDKFVKTISTMGFTPSQKLSEKAELTFNQSVAFDLPNVFFDYNSFAIKPAAAKELDKIAEVMNKFPEVQIELSAHTDSRGKSTINMVLSAQRAKACVDYLASKGVNKTHIIAIGYGEEKIRNRCVDDVEPACTDKEHSYNRRTEFKVVKFD